ncbi:MAG TPA: glycosyltransferase 87 family protein, partial [Thermoanaerobaculia bacterium]|nr:glycosyltransferase 87 family protein [Thermoanaerobaculia bacterium]
MTAKRAIVVVAGALLVLAGLRSAWNTASTSHGLDFYQFWIGGQEAPHVRGALWSPETAKSLGSTYYYRAVSGKSERMYVVAQGRRELELFSTPFLYTCFGLLPADYDRAYLIWSILGLASLVAAIAMIARALRWPLPALLFFLAFVLLLFQPLTSELRVENVNELQLLIIAAYFVTPPAIRGAILGIAIALKPNVAIALPLVAAFEIAHDRRKLLPEMLGVAAGGTAAVAVSAAYFRSATVWIAWLRAARTLSQNVYARDTGNVAPALFLGRYAWVLAIVLTVGAMFLVIRHREASAPFAVSLGLVVYLLSAPLVWLHYLLLAIPLAMILL